MLKHLKALPQIVRVRERCLVLLVQLLIFLLLVDVVLEERRSTATCQNGIVLGAPSSFLLGNFGGRPRPIDAEEVCPKNACPKKSQPRNRGN